MSKETLAPILAALQAVVIADGSVTPEEEAWLKGVVSDSGFEVPDAHQLTAEELREALPTAADRESIVRLMLDASLADGVTSELELRVITRLAALLEVSSARVDELRRQADAAAPKV